MKFIPVILLLLTACGTYRHTRPVELYLTGATNFVVVPEVTEVKLFFQKLAAARVKTAIKDGDYSRTVTVGELGLTGDAEMIQAISEGVAEGLLKARQRGVLPPP